MDRSLPSPRTYSVLPWSFAALLLILAAGSFLWMNQRIEAMQTAVAAIRPEPTDETKQTIASLSQAIEKIQADQQKLGDQIGQLQRGVAAEQGERKLLSDQIGSLSVRVNALASAQATAAAPTEPSQQGPQAQKNRHRR